MPWLGCQLICSQDGNPGTSKSHGDIQRETGISSSTVRRTVKYDLTLKIFRSEVQKLSDFDAKKRLQAACVLREHPLSTSTREGEGATTMGTYGDRGVKVNKDVPFKY